MKNFTKVACFLALICGNNLFATTFYVSNTNGAGAGSLNQAVNDANADASATAGTPHVIEFCVSGVINASPNYGNWMVLNGPKDLSLKIVGSNSIQNSSLATKFVTFNNLVFTGVNASSFGGAVMLGINATLNYNNCRFTNCLAFDHGGAVFNNGNTMNFNGCTFDNNQTVSAAGWAGGAIANNGGICSFVNCTFFNNHSASAAHSGPNGAGGGAIINNGGTSTIANCSFFGNTSANQGGAVHNRQGATCNISNSIFTGNTADTTGQDISGVFNSSFGHNIVGSNTGGFSLTGYTSGNVVGVLASVVFNSNNPSFTFPLPTLDLKIGSPAINAGNTAGTPPAKDQRGFSRTGILDIGSIEFNGGNPCNGFSVNLGPAAVAVGLPFIAHSNITNGTGPIHYQWNAGNNYTCGVDTFIANGYGMLKLNISDSLGCIAQDSINISAPERALAFDGVNDHLRTPSDTSLHLDQFTIEAYIKTSSTAFQNIIMKGYYGYGLAIDNGTIEYWDQYSGGAGPNSNLGVVPIGQWTHIAVTHDGTNISFYINGVLDSSSPSNIINNNGGDLTLGIQGVGCACNYFQGAMDEVRVWNTVRTVAQIQNNMNCDVAQQPGLVAYYRFNQGVANSNNTGLNHALDFSGNGHCAVANNFTMNGGTSNWTNGPIGSCNPISPPVNPSVNISASGAITFCAGDSVILTASGANNYSWSNGPTSNSITVTTSGTYTLIGYTPCGSDTATMVITVNPLPSVSAGADQTVCSGSNVTLTGSGATTYVWTGSVTDGVSFVLGATASYAVTGTDANGCSASDSVTVFVDALPTTSSAGTDQTWCEATSAVLTGNTPIIGTGAWSLVGGGVANISNPSSPTSSVTGLAGNTSYTLRWTITNGVCSDVDDMVISNYSAPTTANAGADTTVCTFSGFTLNANNPTTGTGVWTIISGQGTLADSSVFATGLYNLLADSAVVLRWTISTNPVCSDSYDDIIVTGLPAPIVNAGIDQTICPGTNASLNGTLTNATGASWTTSGTGTFSPNATTLNAQYAPSGADLSGGSVTLTLNVTGCGNGYYNDALLSFVANGISYAHLSGNVTSVGSPVTAGLITLFEKLPDGSINLSDTLSISNGTYAFDSIPAGKYTLYYRCGVACGYAVRPTYLGDVAQYQLSDSLTIGCQDTLANVDISALQVVQAPTGSGTISGQIVVGGVFKNMQQGDPIPGVDVALEQNPGSVMMSYGQTDATGNFTFANIAYGSYIVVADIPGYGLDTSMVQVINSTTPIRSVLLCSDTTITEIGVCASVTGIANADVATVSIAPNPSNGIYVLTTNIISDVVIYNGLGQLVKTLKVTEGRNTFSLENEANGIYLVQIKSAKGVTSSKIVKE